MPETAFIFPGQGAQRVGMGKDLAEASPLAARVFEQANEILGFDLSRLCFDGPADRLEATDIQQPAIFVTSWAFWTALNDGGEAPGFSATAGLSLGEYTALCASGSLGFDDAVRLVYKRGQYMQEAAQAVPSGMVSVVGLECEEVAELCVQAAEGEILTPANFNCPGQIVISGSKPACARAVQIVESAEKGRAIVLKVAGAFHSELMKPAAEKLNVELERTDFAIPKIPVISNVDATAHGSADQIRSSLYRQVFSPVRWQSSVEKMIADGIERFVEVGPGRGLTGMMRKIDRNKTAVNISSVETLDKFASCSPSGSIS